MITVGIKTLNEARHIDRALAHALQAVAPFGGRVVLADSGSTDGTIAIARRYPVQVVQLADPGQRCCGAGAQLAFQYADTAFFYLQDGDMALRPGFLDAAIAYLDAHPDVAAVGGHVVERTVASEEFEIRVAAQQREAHRRPGLVDRLDGGGLYRVAAVRQVGYFADRNLHAFEEFDLAARLHAAGWKLARIDAAAVDHDGHALGGYRLLWRRFASGYAAGSGEVLRAALGKRHLRFVLGHLRHLRHAVAVLAWWVALAAAALRLPATLPLLVAGPLLLLWVRRGSLRLAVYSAASWNVAAAGFVRGIVRRRLAPALPLDARDLSHPLHQRGAIS